MGDLLRLEGRRAATFGMKLGQFLARNTGLAFARSSESMYTVRRDIANGCG